MAEPAASHPPAIQPPAIQPPAIQPPPIAAQSPRELPSDPPPLQRDAAAPAEPTQPDRAPLVQPAQYVPYVPKQSQRPRSAAVLLRGESISLARRAAATAKKRREEARAELERQGVREGVDAALAGIVGASASTRANVSQNKSKRHKRVKWTPEEVVALREGVARYGEGRWAVILREFAASFNPVRISVDLKDKWRNLYKSHKLGPLPQHASNHPAIAAPTASGGVRDVGVREVEVDGQKVAVREPGVRAVADDIAQGAAMMARGAEEMARVAHAGRITRSTYPKGENMNDAIAAAVGDAADEVAGERVEDPQPGTVVQGVAQALPHEAVSQAVTEGRLEHPEAMQGAPHHESAEQQHAPLEHQQPVPNEHALDQQQSHLSQQPMQVGQPSDHDEVQLRDGHVSEQSGDAHQEHLEQHDDPRQELTRQHHEPVDHRQSDEQPPVHLEQQQMTEHVQPLRGEVPMDQQEIGEEHATEHMQTEDALDAESSGRHDQLVQTGELGSNADGFHHDEPMHDEMQHEPLGQAQDEHQQHEQHEPALTQDAHDHEQQIYHEGQPPEHLTEDAVQPGAYNEDHHGQEVVDARNDTDHAEEAEHNDTSLREERPQEQEPMAGEVPVEGGQDEQQRNLSAQEQEMEFQQGPSLDVHPQSQDEHHLQHVEGHNAEPETHEEYDPNQEHPIHSFEVMRQQPAENEPYNGGVGVGPDESGHGVVVQSEQGGVSSPTEGAAEDETSYIPSQENNIDAQHAGDPENGSQSHEVEHQQQEESMQIGPERSDGEREGSAVAEIGNQHAHEDEGEVPYQPDQEGHEPPGDHVDRLVDAGESLPAVQDNSDVALSRVEAEAPEEAEAFHSVGPQHEEGVDADVRNGEHDAGEEPATNELGTRNVDVEDDRGNMGNEESEAPVEKSDALPKVAADLRHAEEDLGVSHESKHVDGAETRSDGANVGSSGQAHVHVRVGLNEGGSVGSRAKTEPRVAKRSRADDRCRKEASRLSEVTNIEIRVSKEEDIHERSRLFDGDRGEAQACGREVVDEVEPALKKKRSEEAEDSGKEAEMREDAECGREEAEHPDG